MSWVRNSIGNRPNRIDIGCFFFQPVIGTALSYFCVRSLRRRVTVAIREKVRVFKNALRRYSRRRDLTPRCLGGNRNRPGQESKSRRALPMRRNRIRNLCQGVSRRKRQFVSLQGNLVHGLSALHRVGPARTRRLPALRGQLAETLWVWPLRAAESICLWPLLAAWFLLYRWSPDPP
jgi:hypothetical protein